MKRLLLVALLIAPSMISVNAQTFEDIVREGPDELLRQGRSGKREYVASLRKIKNRKEKELQIYSRNAQMALAKLGESREMREIVKELSDSNPRTNSQAIQKLKYVANKGAVRALIAQLDNKTRGGGVIETRPDGSTYLSDEVFLPPSSEAMIALAEIVPNPPQIKKRIPTDEDIPKWKTWWNDNRSKYE